MLMCAVASPYQSNSPRFTKNMMASIESAERPKAREVSGSCEWAATGAAFFRCRPFLGELRESLELTKPIIDLLTGKRTEAIDAEHLATEAAHHRTVNDSAAQNVRVIVFARIQTIRSDGAEEARSET